MEEVNSGLGHAISGAQAGVRSGKEKVVVVRQRRHALHELGSRHGGREATNHHLGEGRWSWSILSTAREEQHVKIQLTVRSLLEINHDLRWKALV